MKSIHNYNKKGDYHGYQEWYNTHAILWFRGNFKHGRRIGYMERHGIKYTRTIYHIK